MKSYLLYFFAFLIAITSSPFAAKLMMRGSGLTVCVISDDGGKREMDIEEYVASALSCLTDGDEEAEYLKALSVALRSTAVLICTEGLNHPIGEVCTQRGCCIPIAECRDYAADAASSTKGEYLTYDGAPMLAPFCDSVGRYTANSNSLDYLVSVKNVDEGGTDGFETVMSMSIAEFASLLSLPEGADLHKGCVVYDSTGRCAFFICGGVQIAADEMQKIFSLPSAEFEIVLSDGNVVITCRGSGSGIGMSLGGSRILAGNGYLYDEILKFYFPLGEINFI